MTSCYWGMKNIASLKKAVAIMFRGVLLLGLALSIVTLMLLSGIMGPFSPEDAVIHAGVSYFMISISCYLVMGYSMTTSLVLRSVGKANIPLYSSIGAFFINIFLTGYSFLEISAHPGWRNGELTWERCLQEFLNFASLWDSSFSERKISGSGNYGSDAPTFCRNI